MRKWVTVFAALAIAGVSTAQAAEKLKVAIPQKARIRLMLVLTRTSDPAEISRLFRER